MNGTTQALSCPKCGSEMRSYERNGVTVDQCTGCRGVFLDRGELERLIDAEGAYYEREIESSSRGRGDRDERRDRDGRRDRDDDDRRERERHGKPRKSKKKSFLESIMEMGE